MARPLRIEYHGAILVRHDEPPKTIRLIVVDTPETKDPPGRG
jgi:endonuclease YncB( thermonuclease family)